MLAAGKHKDGMLRLMESLTYEKDPSALAESIKLAEEGAAELKKEASSQALEKKKDDIMQVRNAFKYLIKHKILPARFGPKKVVDKVIADQGWNKKK